MSDDRKHTKFRGTPLELEAWLRRFFDIIRIYMDSEPDSVTMQLFEKSAWELDISAVEGLLKDRVRPDLRPYGDVILIERELFDLLAKMGDEDTDQDDVDGENDTMSSETTDLED